MEKESLSDDWSVECSDDEKYEIKTKWVTVGVSCLPLLLNCSPFYLNIN